MTTNTFKTYRPVDALLEDYKALWFWQKWFFPSALKNELEIYSQHPSIDPSPVYNVLENTWFFQRWICSCLRNFATTHELPSFEEPLLSSLLPLEPLFRKYTEFPQVTITPSPIASYSHLFEDQSGNHNISPEYKSKLDKLCETVINASFMRSENEDTSGWQP